MCSDNYSASSYCKAVHSILFVFLLYLIYVAKKTEIQMCLSVQIVMEYAGWFLLYLATINNITFAPALISTR